MRVTPVGFVLLCLLCPLCPACSLLETYPPEVERCANGVDDDFDGLIDCADRMDCRTDDACLEAHACADGRDDDLDGLIDCADTDCDGQCPEADLTSCGNGRDDDGDGQTDYADAQCWPFGIVEITRCPTVRGTNALVPPMLGPWRADQLGGLPSPRAVPDPTDASRTLLGLPAFGDTFVRTTDGFDGTWDGTRITIRVYIEGIASALVDVGTREEFDVVGMSLAGPDAMLGASIRSAEPASAHIPVVVGQGWWTLVLETSFDGETAGVHVSATPDHGATTETAVSAGVDWPPTAELVVQIALYGSSTGRTLLDAVTITRPSGRACNDTRAELAGSIHSVAASPTFRCATGAAEGAQTTWALGDSETMAMSASWPAYQTNGDPTVAPVWDAARGVFRGVIANHDGTLALLESPDCVHWTSLGDAVGTSLGVSASTWGYALRPQDGASPARHEIWAVGVLGGAGGVRFATSSTGDPGSFVPGAFLATPPTSGFGTTQVMTIGADHVLSVTGDEMLSPGHDTAVTRLYVERPGMPPTLVELTGARIEPTALPGAVHAAEGADTVLLSPIASTDAHFHGELALVRVRTTEFATMTVRGPALCDAPAPERCNGVDDDCDGVPDDLDPDATLGCPPASAPFTGRRCGAIVSAMVSTPVDAVRFGCVESYDTLPAAFACDPMYTMCTPTSSCDASVACAPVVCAARCP